MAEPIWYLPYDNEKEAWMAAMSDLYDNKGAEKQYDDGRWGNILFLYQTIIGEGKAVTTKLRPKHPERPFMDLWQPGQKLQVMTSESDLWRDFISFDGKWQNPLPYLRHTPQHLKFRPHSEHHPELFAKWKEIEDGIEMIEQLNEDLRG